MRKLKLLFIALFALACMGAWAQKDVTASYIGDLGLVVQGSHNCNNNHKMSQGIGFYNTQTLPNNGWHAFVAPGTSGVGESWTSGIGTKGIMMGRMMVLPEGEYTLKFSAFGTTATNASNTTASSAGDVVAFCTGETDIDITNTTVGGNTFHEVEFSINVTSANTPIEFGIKKVADESFADWCQIKDVKLYLNSTDIVPVDNNDASVWTRTFDGSGTNGDNHCNTWSTEGQSDGSNFLVPFIEDWVASGNTLSDQTISSSYTPEKDGVYKVTAWVRAMNEAGGAISGATIFVGDVEADACGGTAINKGVIGTYTAMADGKAGTPISFGLKLKDAAINWISYKNFTIKYLGESLPEDDVNALLAKVPTGKMSKTVSDALANCVTAFKTTASVANYNALAVAIADANASIVDYNKLYDAIELAGKYNIIDADYNALVSAMAIANNIYNNGKADTCDEAIANLNAAVKAAKINDYAYVLVDFEYPVELGTWKNEGPTGELNSQHWSGEARPYLEQSSAAWGQNSWTISYNQDLTLPAGDYVFKVAGRKAQGDGCTLSLVVKNGENTIGSISNFPEGDTGLGINKSGATSFDPDDEAGFANNGQGRGFEWRYVKFTLSADATINVAVNANATTSHQWVSFCDATIQTNNEANIAMIAYNIALNDAKAAIANDAYKNVTGTEKVALQNAIAADMTGKTRTEVEAATAALKEATTAFTAAAPAYDAYVDIKAKVANLDAAGQDKFAELEADIETELSATTLASVPASYIEAVKAQTTPGADMTGIIVNAAIASTDGWDNARTNANQQYTGAPDNTYFDVYNETRNMTQNIGKLQPGIYTLKCATRASTEMAGKAANVYVSQNSANLASTDIHKDGSADGELGNGWSWTEVKFAVADNTTDITIGFYAECGGNQWAGADNFTLTFNGTLDTKVTISSTGLASFSSVAELAVPTGVEAYYATECTATSVKMTKIEDGKIPANTGVILKAAAGDYTLTATTGATAITGNLLVAATYAIAELAATSGDKTNYILYQGEFRTWDESATVNVAAGKAYLSVPVSAGSLSLQFGDATAIDTVNGTASFNGTRVNVAGQAVSDSFKGIVIMNGKKVLVK